MTVHRFFVSPDDLGVARFRVPATIERQVRTVLRLRDGDRIVVLGGDGDELVCRLEGGDCVVEDRRPAAGEPAHRLTVVQALLKGDALERVVQHGTEMGVAAFRLVVTERTVARDLSPRRLDRLRAIARESAEQSERGRVPPVDEPIPMADALEPISAGTAAMLLERHDPTRLRDLDVSPDAVLIGPEGGFTPAEVQSARDAGVAVVGLGPRILRSETVATAVAGVILSRTGDFA